MRNLLIVAILMLGMSMMSIAQESDVVVKFIAGHAEVTFTENWNDAELTNVDGQNIVITAIDAESKVTITNKYRDEFIYCCEDFTSDIVDGHKRLNYFYDAVDKENTPCRVLVQYYEDGHTFGGETIKYLFRFRIFYNNVWYGYYANPFVPGEKSDKIAPGSKQL